jgi:hypothetical protein
VTSLKRSATYLVLLVSYSGFFYAVADCQQTDTRVNSTTATAMTCSFDLTLPDTVSLLSHTSTDTEASYRMIEPENTRVVLGSVSEQLTARGWRLEPSSGDKTSSGDKAASTRVYLCETSQQRLQVSFAPVAKSRIYTLSLQRLIK